MTTIKIAYDVSDDAVARVESALNDVLLHDANWSGAEFKIERDEYTWIEGDESHNAASLLHSVIQPAISGFSILDQEI